LLGLGYVSIALGLDRLAFRLGLGVQLKLGFFLYVYFVSTPTALLSCVTVTSQVVYE